MMDSQGRRPTDSVGRLARGVVSSESQPSRECLCHGAVKKPVLRHGASSIEKAIWMRAYLHANLCARSSRPSERGVMAFSRNPIGHPRSPIG
jgi:hypothetical protein